MADSIAGGLFTWFLVGIVYFGTSLATPNVKKTKAPLHFLGVGFLLMVSAFKFSPTFTLGILTPFLAAWIIALVISENWNEDEPGSMKVAQTILLTCGLFVPLWLLAAVAKALST